MYSKIVGFYSYYAIDPMLLPKGNPFKCHGEVVVFADYDST